MPRDAPILVQVMLRDLAIRTQRVSCCSTCAPAAATRGRCLSRSSSLMSRSQAAGSGTGSGFCLMISWHRSTHSLQMNTPGPATILATSEGGLRQNEHAASLAGRPGPCSVVAGSAPVVPAVVVPASVIAGSLSAGGTQIPLPMKACQALPYDCQEIPDKIRREKPGPITMLPAGPSPGAY